MNASGADSARWTRSLLLAVPSAPVLVVLVAYVRLGGTPHFFLHALTGWDVALVVLLAATYRGYSWSRWDGVLPAALALYAMTPDFLYVAGQPHRDWMDVFLLHVSLDEILPIALLVLTVWWAMLVAGYLSFRAVAFGERGTIPLAAHLTAAALPGDPRRHLAMLLVVSAVSLLVLAAIAVVTERTASRPVLRSGQPAPGFVLPSTQGGTQSLAAARGQSVVLTFVPSVRSPRSREHLLTLQKLLPELRARGAVVFAVSTDTPVVQRAAARDLGLTYPVLSEAPTAGEHPAGSAYGLYHLPQPGAGPVDAQAIVVVDGMGIVRAVRVDPDHPMESAQILALVDAMAPLDGG